MINIIFLPWRDIHNYRKEGFRVRESNILKNLSERSDINKILIVNRARNFKSVVFKKTTGMEIKSEILPNKTLIYEYFGSKLFKITENIFSLELPWYFLNKGDNELENYLLFQKYLMFIINKISRLLEIDLNSKNTWVWSSDLTRSYIFKELNNKGLNCIKIFDTIDNLTEHGAYTHKQKEKNKERYKEVDQNVDIIFSVSKANLEILYKNPYVKKYHIENGVDIERFGKFHRIKEKNKKTICGYVGVIESRVNFDLLREIAIKTPEIEYKLVGPVLDSNNHTLDQLQKLNNVHFVGPVSFEEIPSVINNFDVCIIPHVINNFTKSMSPLKFYEYLAANKPIIMTQVPPADSVSKVKGVYIANTVEEWLAALEKAKKIHEEELKNDTERQLLIQRHSWKQIVDHMVNCVLNTSSEVI